MHNEKAFLLRALQKGGLLKIQCKSTEELYEQLAKIASNFVKDIPRSDILKSLGAQGKAFPVYLGQGIAIPNLYSAALEHRICFVFLLHESVQISEAHKVDCIFLLLSPLGDTQGHLATLADISKSCNSNRRLKLIKNAETIDDIIVAAS